MQPGVFPYWCANSRSRSAADAARTIAFPTGRLQAGPVPIVFLHTSFKTQADKSGAKATVEGPYVLKHESWKRTCLLQVRHFLRNLQRSVSLFGPERRSSAWHSGMVTRTVPSEFSDIATEYAHDIHPICLGAAFSRGCRITLGGGSDLHAGGYVDRG